MQHLALRVRSVLVAWYRTEKRNTYTPCDIF